MKKNFNHIFQIFRHQTINVKFTLSKSLKYSAILLMGFSITIISSCTKFLTQELQGEFSTGVFYQNQTQANQAVIGVYNAISFRSSKNAIWVFGDIASDDAVKGGNPGDQAEITFIDEFNANASNGYIFDYWTFSYEAIARANNVIANVPGVPMDEAMKNRFVGEAKFIRAYSYFNLVNVFGRIPLKLLPPVTQAAIQVPLSDVSAIYQQIEKDLTDAAAVLPVSYSPSDIGHVTRGAALAMLGKTSLYQGNWSAALGYFQQVEALGIYHLLPNYADNFKLAYNNSSESIFAIQHLTGQNPFTGNGLNQWFAPAPGGYYFNAPTQSLVDAFEKSSTGEVDPRLDATIGRDGQPWMNGDIFNAGWSPATGYLTKKHQQPFSEVPSSRKEDGGLTYIYLRYADLLLMKAEAFNESGNADSTRANLNKVRQRARASFSGTLPADLLADITTLDKNQLTTAIQKERRTELAQEFHRYFDLMRWGKTVAEAALGPDFNYDSKRYFPIPQAERDANQAINP